MWVMELVGILLGDVIWCWNDVVSGDGGKLFSSDRAEFSEGLRNVFRDFMYFLDIKESTDLHRTTSINIHIERLST